ncbi:MAG: HAD family hydrolase [Thermoanaerobaculia bacterium]
MIEAVLLDMGGVLISLENARGLPDSKHDWRGREALLRVVRQHGGRLEREELESVLFAPWRAEYRQRYAWGREARWEPHLTALRKRAGVRLRDLTLLGAWFRPYGERLTPLPGAADTLVRLREQGLRLALCSNVPMPGALYREILERHELAAPIESFHFSYDEGTRKPSPQMLRNALEVLGVDADRALMVGDRRTSDIAAGRAAGVGTVWVRSDDGGGPQADHEIGSLGELPAIVARLRRA